MSTRTLPYPSRMRDQLIAALPGISGHGAVKVTPRDADGRQCPAWDAAFYEVSAFRVAMSTPLAQLEEALRVALQAWPDAAVRTTQISGFPAVIRDTDWPGFFRRRDRHSLRPQVLAMIADPPAERTADGD